MDRFIPATITGPEGEARIASAELTNGHRKGPQSGHLPVVEPVVPFALPHIDDDDIAAVVEALRSGWITTGPKVRAFEAEFAQRLGVHHAVALNSATAALHLALDAIGMKAGDEVIVPTITFAATAEVVRYFDAHPILVDVEPDTLCLDPAALKSAITPRTRAVIPVHLAGHPADMDAIKSIADEHGLTVIEDAAHAFPCQYRGSEVGTIGDLAAFSFYATKTITTGEGGMLVTNDARYAERARMMALHGMSRDSWKRYTTGGSWRYDVFAPGFKYNMTDLAAALGLSQLRKADWMWQRRKTIAERYTSAFERYATLEVPRLRDGVSHAWHLYPLRIDPEQLGLTRDAFIDALEARGVKTSVHFIPLHTFTYYRNTYGYQTKSFPVASRAFERYLSLPIYPAMSDRDVDHVIEAVVGAVGTHDDG